MRKIIAIILLCAILVSAISGCGNSGNDSVAAYIDMAQGFIDNGDYEAAMDVLRKGYTATSDDRLAVMIAECMTALSGATTESSAQDDPTQTTVPTTSATEPTTIDLSLFEGSWAEENIGWLNGGMILDVFPNGDGADICLNLVEEAPFNSIAEAWIDIENTNIINGEFSAEFEDSWGTTGTVHLCFTTESITCEITDISFPEDTWWGMCEGLYTLFLNNDAYESLNYTMEEFYEEFPELIPEETTPTYDTSKASGILAEMGMTEEEFRAACQPLALYGTNVGLTTLSDLIEYPGNYVGQLFYFSKDNYEGRQFQVADKGILNDGSTAYMCKSNEYFIVFDCRDDVYSPTISKGDWICPYMIFEGIQTVDGIDFLCFGLVSVDK